MTRLVAVAIAAVFAPACTPDDPPTAAVAAPIGEWRAYGADKAGTKYSPLDEINRETIGNLRIAWRRSGMPEELPRLRQSDRRDRVGDGVARRVSNAPMTYSAGGKQYIVVGVSGSEHPGELIALSLP